MKEDWVGRRSNGEHCDRVLISVCLQDRRIVERLAEAPSAFESTNGEEPLCVRLTLPQALDRKAAKGSDIGDALNEFVTLIRSSLAKGQAVVVNGWMPELSINFTVEEIGIICPTLEQVVQYQGKLWRTTLRCASSTMRKSHR
jgi:hypothetical protein